MPQSTPKTSSIMAVVLILGCLAGAYYLFYNLYPSYTEANASYAVAADNNTKLKQALDSVSAFLASYKDQEMNADAVKLALPAGDADVPNFISSLSQLATASGVGLSNFLITNPPDTGVSVHSVQAVDLSLSASGSYSSFKDFILRVETHMRLIDIYHVSVSSQPASGGTPILLFQIKMRTYFQQ